MRIEIPETKERPQPAQATPSHANPGRRIRTRLARALGLLLQLAAILSGMGWAAGVPAATPVLTLGFVQPFPPYRVGSKLDITIRVTNHSNSPVSTAYVKFAFSGNVSFASYVSPADPEWLCNGSQLCSMTVLNPVDVVPANGGTAQFDLVLNADHIGTGTLYAAVGPDATNAVPTPTACTGYNAPSNGCAGPLHFNIVGAETTTTLTSSLNPASLDDSVYFTANVAVSGKTYLPGGTVTFTRDGAAFCSNVALSAGKATCGTRNYGTATNNWTAQYNGDGTNYAPSTSATLAQVFTKGKPTLSLTSSNNPAQAGSAITFTAKLAINPNNLNQAASGTINFTESSAGGALTICANVPVASNQATCTVPAGSAASSFNVGAAYGGDGVFNSAAAPTLAQSVVSKASPSVSVATRSSSGSFFVEGGSGMYTATLSGGNSATGSVSFYTLGDTSLPIPGCNPVPLSGGKASCTQNALTAGSHTISAQYLGDSNNNASPPASASFVVLHKTAMTLTVTPSNNVTLGQTLVFPYDVTTTASSAPTGSVAVSIGDTALCENGSLAGSGPGVAHGQCSWTPTKTGSFTISAIYLGDANNAPVASPQVAVNVTPANYTVTPSAGAHGSISPSSAQTVTAGAAKSFTVAADPGYSALVGGSCGGTLSGNIYTTAPVGADCTVVASFAANPVDGACGADNGVLVAVAPTVALCAAGNASVVTVAKDKFGWTCNGVNKGSSATCSAPRAYTITAAAAANGTITPSGTRLVAYGTTASYMVTANAGYTARVTGCGGSLSGNTYATGVIEADCGVVASFDANDAAAVRLNQAGLSGTWYNPATGGQGFVLSTMPDVLSPGHGLAFAGWFTYDIAPAGGAEKQRWYAVQGAIDDTDPIAALDIYTGSGGNFDATPKISPSKVGTATLQFSDCSHGTLAYHFDDGSGRGGSIPLSRLDANLTCTPMGDNGASAPTYLLSGVWYKPETSGQGLVFDINPSGNLLFAAWYTYAQNGASADAAASQRWYTLQLNDYTPSTQPRAGIPIYTATQGVFDNAAHTLTGQLGSATLTFIDCGRAKLDYHFSDGSNAGLSGSVDLVKLGSVAAQCGL